jgi:hypothetical protein
MRNALATPLKKSIGKGSTTSTAIRTIIAAEVKQNHTAGYKTDISKWTHLLSFLTYLQIQLPTTEQR